MKLITERSGAYFLTALVLLSSVFILLNGFYNRQQEERLRNTPVDVLTNWTLRVDDSKTYMPGDVIQVESKFTKLINVKGTSERYIQCMKAHSMEWDGLVLSNRTKGTQQPIKNGKATYGVGIPLNVGELPNTCRVCPVVTYNVNKYHPAFQETTCSNTFTIEPRPGIVTNPYGQTIIYTNGKPQDKPDDKASIVIPSDSQPIVITQQTSQPEANEENSPSTVRPKGIVNRVLDVANGAVNSVLNIFR